MKVYSYPILQVLTMSAIILFSTVLLLELTLTFIHLCPIVYLFGITWTPLLCVHPLFQLLRPSYVLPHYFSFSYSCLCTLFCFVCSFFFLLYDGPCLVLAYVLYICPFIRWYRDTCLALYCQIRPTTTELPQ